VLGFPLSWLIDRKNRRNIVAACLVLWSVMTAVCGLARTSWQFFFARVGVTIGEAGGTPGANSLLSDYFPANRRAMALTVFALGAPIGAWLGYNVAGAIADHYGWRAVFFALGIPECWPGSRYGSPYANPSAVVSMRVIRTPRPFRRPCASCGSNAPRCTS